MAVLVYNGITTSTPFAKKILGEFSMALVNSPCYIIFFKKCEYFFGVFWYFRVTKTQFGVSIGES